MSLKLFVVTAQTVYPTKGAEMRHYKVATRKTKEVYASEEDMLVLDYTPVKKKPPIHN